MAFPDFVFSVIRSDVLQEFDFFVPGKAVPQGSKKAFVTGKKAGGQSNAKTVFIGKPRATMTDVQKGLIPWREKVAKFCLYARPENWEVNGVFMVCSIYYLARPKKHFTSKGLLHPDAPLYCGNTPDTDKLDRARGDALKGIAYCDDARIVSPFSLKLFQHPDRLPGAHLFIARLSGKPGLTETPDFDGAPSPVL